MNELREVVNVGLRHVGLHHIFAKCFSRHRVKQQAGRGIGVVGVFLNQSARSQHRCFVDLVHRDAVIQIAHGLRHDRVGFDICAQACTGGFNQAPESVEVKHDALTVVYRMQLRSLWCLNDLLCALLSVFLTVQHISTSHFVMTAPHQAQLHLVLNVFNMKGATAGAGAHQSADDALCQLIDCFANTGGGSTLCAGHGQKSLHHGHRNFCRLEWHNGAIAANNLVMVHALGRDLDRVVSPGRWGRVGQAL